MAIFHNGDKKCCIGLEHQKSVTLLLELGEATSLFFKFFAENTVYYITFQHPNTQTIL